MEKMKSVLQGGLSLCGTWGLFLVLNAGFKRIGDTEWIYACYQKLWNLWIFQTSPAYVSWQTAKWNQGVGGTFHFSFKILSK